MKLLQFAVASIVDANTEYGLTHNDGRVDHTAAVEQGRAIRARSIIALYSLIKQNIGKAISSYRAQAKKRRQIATLGQLNDHLLQDIGLSREDVLAAQLGRVTLEQLDAERYNQVQSELLDRPSIIQIGQQTLQLDAVNEAVYGEAKCA